MQSIKSDSSRRDSPLLNTTKSENYPSEEEKTKFITHLENHMPVFPVRSPPLSIEENSQNNISYPRPVGDLDEKEVHEHPASRTEFKEEVPSIIYDDDLNRKRNCSPQIGKVKFFVITLFKS